MKNMTRVAIGLGSNWGDRLGFLQAAADALLREVFKGKVRVSAVCETPALLKEDAPAEWDIAFLNAVMVGETTLSPQALLAALKGLEQRLGRQVRGVWAPREIDLDILLYGQQVIAGEALTIPHPHMLSRSFVMQPLKQVAGDWIEPKSGRLIDELADKFQENMVWIKDKIQAPVHPPKWVGIVNVTPDSFSGDGLGRLSPDEVLLQAWELIEAGASVLDIGAESTRPGATPIDRDEEWRRLEPVWRGLREMTQSAGVALSIDTRHPTTAMMCLQQGVDWVNDVNGLQDPAMVEVLRNAACKVVVMHSLGVPADATKALPEGEDVCVLMRDWMRQTLARLEEAGIARERVILDPGIGFGKIAAQNWALLEQVNDWRLADVPVLIGHSRKRFLEVAPESRDAATLEVSKMLAQAGVEYLRVHDVAGHVRAFAEMV